MNDACENQRKIINKLIYQIENLNCNYIIQQTGDGKEHLVRYDISEAWKDYLFVLNGILYRWDNCFGLLLQIKDEIKKLSKSFSEDMIMCNWPTCDKLSYEFENLIVSFNKINENPMIMNLSQVMSPYDSKKLKDNCYKDDSLKGLFWKINLLRNRSAHSTPGYYSDESNEAQRYMSISSRVFNIEIKEGKLYLKTTLINLDKNEYVRKIIQDVKIDKKFGKKNSQKPIMDLIFSKGPKEKNMKNHNMSFISNLGFFDLNEDFIILSLQMFNYIETQLQIIKKEFEEKITKWTKKFLKRLISECPLTDFSENGNVTERELQLDNYLE